jgi:acyl dehydratase
MTLSRGDSVPTLSSQIDKLHFPKKQLAGYLKLCEYDPASTVLPLPAPHLLTTPLHLALLTHPNFPLPAMGLVHAKNVIKQARAIPAMAAMDIKCNIIGTRWSNNGVEIDVGTFVRVDGVLLWEEVSTYFQRTSSSAPKKTASERITPDVTWSLPSSLGRQYGAVSGDRNPIHLWPLTARLFGFKRHIVHGMWTLAKCVSTLENGSTFQSCTLTVDFKRPCFLPCEVGFVKTISDAKTSFRAFRPDNGKNYLEGTLSVL